MSNTDQRIALLNKTSQLKQAEAKVKARSKNRKAARQKRGQGIFDHLVKTNCFGTNPKLRYKYFPGNVAKTKPRLKRGKGWGNLAALGLSTAAKGVWNISEAGRQKRYRDQEALNKINADYYANHYHGR